MTIHQDLLDKLMQDPKFKEEYEDLQPNYQIAMAITRVMIDSNLSIKDVSKKTGISKSKVNKLLTLDANPRLSTLKKISKGLGVPLIIFKES